MTTATKTRVAERSQRRKRQAQTNNELSKCGRAALRYVRDGWPVFPLWWVEDDGRCACGDDDCDHAGKHPLWHVAPHGFKDATTIALEIRRIWKRYPKANVGVATGPKSGLFVLDVDPRSGGDDSLARLQQEIGELPRTVLARSGGGGWHYYFALDDEAAKFAKEIDPRELPGLDIKADGGYIVAPPSSHVQGVYLWERGPKSTGLAPLPDKLRERALKRKGKRSVSLDDGDDIPSGARNTTLFSVAGALRRYGLGGKRIATALAQFNAQCAEPLDDAEVERIAESISRYDAQALLPIGKVLPDLPHESCGELIVPQGYWLTDTETGKVKATKTKAEAVAMATASIVIASREVDVHTGTEAWRVSWRRDDGWHERTIERADAIDSRRLLKLGAYGFPIDSTNARDLTRYLRAFADCNDGMLATRRCTDQMGWIEVEGELGFLLGERLIRRRGSSMQAVMHARDDGEEQIVAGVHRKGKAQQWLRAVRLAADYPKVMAVLHAAFAAPLLHIVKDVGARNFVVDVSGVTSRGKTTVARFAGSINGCPREDAQDGAKVVHTWDSTGVGSERMAALVSGLPLVLDDTMRARPDAVAKTIYQYVHGAGRSRGSLAGLARTHTWSGVLISTGERPATSYTTDGGTRTRVLSLLGSPFEQGDNATGKIVDEINTLIASNYGMAGPRYIRYLIEHQDDWPEWRRRYKRFVADYIERGDGSEAAHRLAKAAAAVSLAGQLAHDAMPQLGEYHNPMQELWTEVLDEAADPAGVLDALRIVVAWARAHPESFWGRHQWYEDREGNTQPRVPYKGEWAGVWKPSKRADAGPIAFGRGTLEEILSRAGYSTKQMVEAWDALGYLDVDVEKGRRRKTKKRRINGVAQGLYQLNRRAIAAADAGD